MKLLTRESFMARTRPAQDGCIAWVAGRNKRYGALWDGQRMVYAHRVSWSLSYGEIPAGMSVLHKCDNTFCVNPEHLFLGTQADNLKDMHTKKRDRKAKGEGHYYAKLTDNTVREIRQLAGTMSLRALAQRYGLKSHSGLVRIIKGTAWKHVV